MNQLSYRAAIFDLDGVVTNTAKVHALAWKDLFDSYLLENTQKNGGEFREFDLHHDYLAYVDGKPRVDGIASFLASRGISLPFGSHNNEPNLETVCGLGNKKDKIFIKLLKEKGVEIFDSTVKLIHELKNAGVCLAIASSSKNCKLVLETTGLDKLFEIRIDGLVSLEKSLKGKPAPDIFLECAKFFKTEPAECIIFEDAVSGVQAGRNGKFGLVIGIDQVGQSQVLYEQGAHVVVTDLGGITINHLETWYIKHNS